MRSDDEILAWLVSPNSPLRPGTEVTPDIVARYRDTGTADQQMDAQAKRVAAENAAYRAAQTASMGALVEGPMSSGVADPAAAFQQFVQSGYTGADALRDGWLTGRGRTGWEPTAAASSEPQSPVSAMYGPTPSAPPAPAQSSPAPYSPPPPAPAPSQPSPPPAAAANTIPPPATQPGASSGPSSMPAPPSTQQPTSQKAPQPSRPRGFGTAPRWNGGGMGFGQRQQQQGGWGQQRQAMRNMYGGG